MIKSNFYAGSERVASKIGAGFGGALVDMDENTPSHGIRNSDGTFTPTEYVKPIQHAQDENPKNIDPEEMQCLKEEAAARIRTEYLKVQEKKASTEKNKKNEK